MTAQRTDSGRTLDFKPWTLPLIVGAIMVPILAGFVLGGPLVGLPMGFAVAAAIVVLAARQVAEGPIETVRSSDARRRVLVVVSHELDDPGAIERIKSEQGLEDEDDEAEVLVMAPARSGLLDRWASDLGPARAEAQRKLVLSLASLGKAGVRAEPTLGDQSIAQGVEDQLREFAATEVVLVTGTPEDDPDGDRAARELARRLEQPLSHIAVDGRSAPGAGGSRAPARVGG